MDKYIKEAHEDGFFEINRPVVYKSLNRCRIEKVKIVVKFKMIK